MSALNLRVDARTAAFLERVARQSGRTKSEIVREALEALRKEETRPKALAPSETMAHLIGCWDSGGMKLSEHTGERFAQLLRESRNDHRVGRRGTTRRPD
jgi:Arc/MetJ-type ribon-helix-helix transcriptional regulator